MDGGLGGRHAPFERGIAAAHAGLPGRRFLPETQSCWSGNAFEAKTIITEKTSPTSQLPSHQRSLRKEAEKKLALEKLQLKQVIPAISGNEG